MKLAISVLIAGLLGAFSQEIGGNLRKLQFTVSGKNVNSGQQAGGDINNSGGSFSFGPAVGSNSGQINTGDGVTMNQQNGLTAGQLTDLLKGIPDNPGTKSDFVEVTRELFKGKSHDDFLSDLKNLQFLCKNAEDLGLGKESCPSQGTKKLKKWQGKLSQQLSASSDVIRSVLMSAIIKSQCDLHKNDDVGDLLHQGVCEAFHKWENNNQEGRRLFGPIDDLCDASSQRLWDQTGGPVDNVSTIPKAAIFAACGAVLVGLGLMAFLARKSRHGEMLVDAKAEIE